MIFYVWQKSQEVRDLNSLELRDIVLKNRTLCVKLMCLFSGEQKHCMMKRRKLAIDVFSAGVNGDQASNYGYNTLSVPLVRAGENLCERV